ncbi:carbohydrate kinase [Demequina sp. NBRC 110052]|uniref:carbohydrate kinase family protein n=1 Tax=Demequina sp. NBRC 110052 TaxID=1570341 RepID=UPI0009FE27F1|nr:carbohydrate kinase [Demequina sp. NBRC 110052]
MSHALVVGEALVDIVYRADGSEDRVPGGSPANVALTLARLGRDAELLTHLGTDEPGAAVAAHLAASGVTLAPGSTDAARTSAATAVLDADGAATYVFDLAWHVSPAAAPRPAPAVLHTGSIAAVIEPGATDVRRLAAELRSEATITYDPNARPALMGTADEARPVIESMVALSDVVKVSDEDLAWLAEGQTPEEVCQAWVALGPAVVIVTRGGDGASAFLASGERVDVPAPAVTVVDTVGAGDSFMGGLIDGLWSAGLLGASHRDALRSLSPATLKPILERCARIAAVTVSRAGANPPTSAELGEA